MRFLPRIMRWLGWIFFCLMWIPFTFIFFTMPGEGSYSFNELPTNMIYSLGGTFGLMIIAMGFLFGASIVGWGLKQIARARGEKVTARVLKITHTGLRVNRIYDELRFELEINYMGETIRTSTEKLSSRFDQKNYQNGMTIEVLYDPMTKLVAMD